MQVNYWEILRLKEVMIYAESLVPLPLPVDN